MHIRYLFFCLFFLSFHFVFSQNETQIISLDKEAYERLFLEKNLNLIAKHLRVSQEQALLIQEKAWNNPTLSISDANLWTPSQEPSVQQFEIALETLIQTAGKRKHRIRMQELSEEIAVKEYETLLRQLKKEVRSKLAALVYYQEILPVYHHLYENITQMLAIHKKQTEQRHFPKEEYLRLQTLVLELNKEIIDKEQEKQELVSELLQYIQMSPSHQLYIEPWIYTNVEKQFLDLDLKDLTHFEKRPDIERLNLEKEYAETAIKLSRSLAYPDLSIEASYNRLDGMWKDYIGFGVEIELPIFNRNKGNIRFAEEEIKIQEANRYQYQMQMQHEMEKEYQRLKQLLQIRTDLDPDYQGGLKEMLDIYMADYKNRNINLLMFLDIQEAYLQGQEMLLELEKEIIETWESLQYQIGLEN